MIEYAKKRYKNYDICFLKGEILEVLKSNINDNSIDFIYCLGMTFHYDTKEIETSPYLEEVILSFVKKLKPTGVLFYSWYTVKSDKAHFPVNQDSLSKVLNRINITNYQMRINPVNSFNNPTLECIIRKNV
jgi:2-polyprenyl-3-methyl-5-hydroxy-6-metoxy-1,4-benzoquinol methylase